MTFVHDGIEQIREQRHTDSTRDLTTLLAALRASAAQRDREGGHAAQEKRWIADAGLLTLAVPREFGGAGARWSAIYDVVRELARVDSARVHALHDPLDYRVRDVGRYALSGTLPEVSLYT